MPDRKISAPEIPDATDTTGLAMAAAQGGVSVRAPASLFENAGAAASAISTHEAAANPHPQYLTQAEGDALYEPLGGAAVAPVVASQTIEFGRLTISGAGGADLSLTSGTYTSITLGTRTIGSDHFTTSGTLITPTAVPSDPLYRWTGCTVSDGTSTSASFTLTIETINDAYSIRSAAQLSAAVSAIGTASSRPITIYGRNVDLGYIIGGATPFNNITYANRVTIASHDTRKNEDGSFVAPLKFSQLTVEKCPLLAFKSVLFQSQPSVSQGANANYAIINLGGIATADILFEDCEICADDVFDVTASSWASTGFWIDFMGLLTYNDGTGVANNITISNCYIHDIGYGAKMGTTTGSLTFIGNRVERYYTMACQFSKGAGNNLPIRCSFNTVGLPFGQAGDANAPHCDAFQLLALGSTVDWTDIEFIGNRLWQGNARGNPQGLFFSDMPVGFFFTAKVYGNVIENASFAAIEISRSKDCDIAGNTCSPPYAVATSSLARISVGQTASSGNSLVRDNIATDYLLGTAVTSSNNVDLGNAVPYDTQTVFVGPWVTAEDVDHLTEMYRIKPKGAADILEPKAGVSPYIDYVNRRFDSPRFRGIGVAESMSGIIASPSNKDYLLAVKMAYAFRVVETTTKSASGTCTATFKINSTALGGTANSVSSTEQTQAHTTSNTGAAGDDLVVTVSSNSSCADMSFKVEWVRLG